MQARAAPRRGRPSAEETRRRMAEVLKVARREFVRNGYRATTLESIAAAAGVSKRSLYLWHADKEALFKACVQEGAERFPLLEIRPGADVRTALCEYATAMIRELASEFSFGMALLLLREGRDFPELLTAARQGLMQFMIEPLARYLRQHGLERPDSTSRASLLITMILGEIHNSMLVDTPLPDDARIRDYASLVVDVFLRGASVSNT